jgi:hypothetical protein
MKLALSQLAQHHSYQSKPLTRKKATMNDIMNATNATVNAIMNGSVNVIMNGLC